MISTDYETYALVYACDQEEGSWYVSDNFWVLSRTPTLSDDMMLEIVAMVEDRLPSYDFFYNQYMTKQDDTCFWA